jgi:diacylglycerol O-acyltransferase
VAHERTPRPIEMLARALPDVAATPFRATRALASSTRALWRARGTIGRDAAIGAPRLRWNDPLSARRSATITSLPLAEVKAVAHAAGATVNDVILAVIGGACRAYLDERRQLPDASLVAAVPVSLHGAGAVDGTNAVSLIFTKIGTDIDDPAVRLTAVRDATVEAKRRHEAVGGDTLTSWLAVAGTRTFSMVRRVYLELGLAAYAPPLVDLLISNVPGPPVTLYFGGAQLRGLYPLGPIYDGVGLNVTVVSSADTIGFGFVTCPDVLTDVDSLAAGVHAAFDTLRAVTLQATATSLPA